MAWEGGRAQAVRSKYRSAVVVAREHAVANERAKAHHGG
jgi:hypothetical protein